MSRREQHHPHIDELSRRSLLKTTGGLAAALAVGSASAAPSA
ncbi:twin-arginine translocation signal domain-containing protein, partial [Streptomyces diastatochromogenes]